MDPSPYWVLSDLVIHFPPLDSRSENPAAATSEDGKAHQEGRDRGKVRCALWVSWDLRLAEGSGVPPWLPMPEGPGVVRLFHSYSSHLLLRLIPQSVPA